MQTRKKYSGQVLTVNKQQGRVHRAMLMQEDERDELMLIDLFFSTMSKYENVDMPHPGDWMYGYGEVTGADRTFMPEEVSSVNRSYVLRIFSSSHVVVRGGPDLGMDLWYIDDPLSTNSSKYMRAWLERSITDIDETVKKNS